MASHLFYEPPPPPSRAEEIAEHREALAEGPPKWWRRDDVRGYRHRHRRDLTRNVFFSRVERGDPIARQRYEWWKPAFDFREKVQRALDQLNRSAAQIRTAQRRLATGCDDKGRPYAASTIKNYTNELRRYDRWWEEAMVELRECRRPRPLPQRLASLLTGASAVLGPWLGALRWRGCVLPCPLRPRASSRPEVALYAVPAPQRPG
jgi:hypothetical protein